MALSPIKGGDSRDETQRQADEKRIMKLVNIVRSGLDSDERAFLELLTYLSFYVKLFGGKYRIPGCDSDEIEQECLYALRYKAIEDFDPERGKFRSFAILCIRRHLFSVIKGSNQQKRRVLNDAVSLDEDRSHSDDNLSLANMVAQDGPPADEELVKSESHAAQKSSLVSRLSLLEKEILKRYLQQYHYDEIVEELENVFPDKKINKKTVDNALVRVRSKAQNLSEKMDWLE